MNKKEDISRMGYRDDSPYREEPFLDINTPSGMIDMSQTGIPLFANGQLLPPYSGQHNMGTTNVREVPVGQNPQDIDFNSMLPKRKGKRKNTDGSISTHIMRTETLDNVNWFSFPTLFENEDGTWLDMSMNKDWMPALMEAKKRKEVIHFGQDKEAALKFGEGSWKPKMGFGGRVTPTGGSQVIEGQLCDAYGRPIDPARAKAADVNNNYRGPGMKYGGALPKAQDGLMDVWTDIKSSLNPYNYSRTEPGDNPLSAFFSGDYEKIPTYYGDDKDKAFSEARKELGGGKTFLHDGIRYKTDYAGETEHIGSNFFLANMNKANDDGVFDDWPGLHDRLIEVWTELGQPDLEMGTDKYDHMLSGQSWDELGLDQSDHVNPLTDKLWIKAYKTKHPRLWMDAVINELTHVKQQREMGRGKYMAKYVKDLIGTLGDQHELYNKDGTLEHQAHTGEDSHNDILSNYIYNGVRADGKKSDTKKKFGGDLPKFPVGGAFADDLEEEGVTDQNTQIEEEINPFDPNEIGRGYARYGGSLPKAQDGTEFDDMFKIAVDNTYVAQPILPLDMIEDNSVEEDVDHEEVLKEIEFDNDLYKDTEEVIINGNTYYVYTIQPGDNKSKVSDKFGLWNEQGILNSVNNKYAKSEDHDNYKIANTKFWGGGKILVGGPEFEPHVKYNTNRNSYINSFQDIPDDQLWSAITAIGHLETGSKVKYARPEGREYIEGVDIKDGKPVPGGLYEYDNNPWTGTVESGMDNAYKFVSSANALGRFGIKETLLDKYGKDVLGYTDDQNWKKTYLDSKTDQQELMKYLITNVYPSELSQIRHSYPEASSQYSDFQLLSALHRAGYGNVEEQLEVGQFSHASVPGDISIGGYIDKAGGLLNPDLNVTGQPFFSKGTDLHKPYSSIPVYSYGGSVGELEPLVKQRVIGDMLENGAFLPKFKLGSEMSIDGELGEYKIKKNFDREANLPYIQYTNSQNNLKNNRVYYDKDDVDGTDNFNIIDLYKQNSDKENETNRLIEIINKYEQGENLSKIEMNYLEELDLVEDKVKPVKVKSTPSIKPTNKFLLDIDINTDIVNKNKDKEGVSLESQISMYQAYTNSLFEDKDDMKEYSSKLKKIYNKLNRVYYWESKASKMTVLDYMKSLNN